MPGTALIQWPRSGFVKRPGVLAPAENSCEEGQRETAPDMC